MTNTVRRLLGFLWPDVNRAPRRRKSRPVVPYLEALEPRTCPDGYWGWNGPGTGGNWSNATGNNWKHNGFLAGANQYPGMFASQYDSVIFGDSNTGPATLDVTVGPILSLQFSEWDDTLTLNNSLTVTGRQGVFDLNDGSIIQLAANAALALVDLGPFQGQANFWSNGTITGAANSSLNVIGSELTINRAPPPNPVKVYLGTNLVVRSSPNTGNKGIFTLIDMTTNLILTGTDNYISVAGGGIMHLDQIIATDGQQNQVGGIALGMAHTGKLAVEMTGDAVLARGGIATAGVPDQVKIGGAVYNRGGLVEVSYGTMLNLTGSDANGYGYWQKTATSAKLQVDSGANLNAAGTYQIDIGTVQLTAPAGGAADELDGGGLVFGDSNTFLTVVDSTPGTPGTVTIQGFVNLAPNTTTTLNFSGANNTADLLDVKNGFLTLNGSLNLRGKVKPTSPLNFFDSSGSAAAIVGAFTSITDNLGGTDTGQIVTNNPQLKYFQVTFP